MIETIWYNDILIVFHQCKISQFGVLSGHATKGVLNIFWTSLTLLDNNRELVSPTSLYTREFLQNKPLPFDGLYMGWIGGCT